MQFRLSPDVDALYLSVERGEVTRTIELSESVYVDIDEQGAILGIEFVNADELLPFLRDAKSLSIESAADDLPELTRDQLRALFSTSAA